jgi:predicted PurR-regulated permease PerM
MPKQRNLAGLIAGLIIVLIILALVILPLTVTIASLVEEAANLHQRIQSGEFDFGRFFWPRYKACSAASSFGYWGSAPRFYGPR